MSKVSSEQGEEQERDISAAVGLRMYDELIAAHTVMRRGATLTAAALARIAAGQQVSLSAAARVVRWQAEFTRHHHASQDELFWPVLRRLFPAADSSLDDLRAQHEQLDAGLKTMTTATETAGGTAGNAGGGALSVREAAAAAATVRDLLAAHLDAEEPVLRDLLPLTPPAEIRTMRKAIIGSAPRSDSDLILGLLHDPGPAPGHNSLKQNFPAPVNLLKPLLLRKYRATKRSLGL